MSTSTGKFVVLYARVSSAAQDVENSIGAQLASLKLYSEQHEHTILGTYTDEAISGRVDKRPGFQQMMNDIPYWDPPVQEVLIWSFSRFTRDMLDAVQYKRSLKNLGVRVVSINEPIQDNASGRLNEGMLDLINAYTSENLSVEIKRGSHFAAGRGFYLAGKAPIGYRKVPVEDGTKVRYTLELDPETWKQIRRGIDMMLAGMSLRDVIQTFNAEGFRTKNGKRWTTAKWHALLMNEVYEGTNVWGKRSQDETDPVRVPNAFPAIMSSEEAAIIREMMSERAPDKMNPRHAGSDRVFAGKIKCRNCGASYSYRPGTGRNNQRYNYVACKYSYENGKELCDGPWVPADEFDRRAMDAILEDIQTPENMTRVLDDLRSKSGKTQVEALEKLNNIEKQLEDIGNREDRLILAYETAELPLEKYSERMLALKGMKENLESEKILAVAKLGDEANILENPEEVLRYTGELNQFLLTAEPSKSKTWLGRFVKCIWVEEGKGTVEYRIPVPDSMGWKRSRKKEFSLAKPVHPSIPPGPPTSPFASPFLATPLPVYKRLAADARYLRQSTSFSTQSRSRRLRRCRSAAGDLGRNR